MDILFTLARREHLRSIIVLLVDDKLGAGRER